MKFKPKGGDSSQEWLWICEAPSQRTSWVYEIYAGSKGSWRMWKKSMKATKQTNYIGLRKTYENCWGLKNILEYYVFFCLFLEMGLETTCVMKEEESEERVTAEEREKPMGGWSLSTFLNKKIRVKCCKQ